MSEASHAAAGRRYQPSREECHKGGQRAAAKLTGEQRRRGGHIRAAQPDFRLLQQRRGRNGARVTRERYGVAVLMEKLAAYSRRRPTQAEAFVANVLETLGLPHERQKIVRVDGRYRRLDFAIPRWALDPTAQDGYYVLEPGDRRWHGGPQDTFDGRDHRALDAALDAQLAEEGYPVLRLDAGEIAQQPCAAIGRIYAFLAIAPRPWETYPCCLVHPTTTRGEESPPCPRSQP
jgi:hypothetical protein